SQRSGGTASRPALDARSSGGTPADGRARQTARDRALQLEDRGRSLYRGVRGVMRVTHLAPSGQIGGAENVILACIAVGDGWPGAKSSLVALGSGPLIRAAEDLGAS